jgi:phenylpyruvate tautomerase PptA (4-oxalocrotonate tautomerase family)
MPQIEIHAPKGAFTPEAKAALVEKASKLLLKMEGAPETPEALGITWCFVREYAVDDLWVGGKPAPYAVYRVVLTVPEGATGFHGPALLERRDAMVRKTTELVLTAEGTAYSPAQAGRVWVQIIEIPNGFWGGFGEIADVMDVATFVGASIVRNPTTRGKRSRATFAELTAAQA